MTNSRLPGYWGRSGGAHVNTYAHCTGSCHGSRRACDCSTGCVELGLTVPPDSERLIQPPAIDTRHALFWFGVKCIVAGMAAGAIAMAGGLFAGMKL